MSARLQVSVGYPGLWVIRDCGLSGTVSSLCLGRDYGCEYATPVSECLLTRVLVPNRTMADGW